MHCSRFRVLDSQFVVMFGSVFLVLGSMFETSPVPNVELEPEPSTKPEHAPGTEHSEV